MAKHSAIPLVISTLALADLGYACLPPIFDNSHFKIYNEVEGFYAEGYVVWSPSDCSNFVSSYGTYTIGPLGPLGPLGSVNVGPTGIRPPSPYHIDVPSGCPRTMARSFVSARISNDIETMFCAAYTEEDSAPSDNYCNLRVTRYAGC